MTKLIMFALGFVLGVHAGAILYAWARAVLIDAQVRAFVETIPE